MAVPSHRPRRPRRLAAIGLALVLAGISPTPAAPVRAGEPDAVSPPAPVSAIVPGSVNRTSLDVRATYDVDVRIRVAARRVRGWVTITAQNVSGAGIDRLHLNTVMAPLGALALGSVTVDDAPVGAVVDDQTIIVPLGGVLPDGETARIVVPFRATLRDRVGGSAWLFTRANGIVAMHRWIPWVSLRRPFDRPNHGDPFVTPVSPRVTVRAWSDVPLRYGTSGRQVAASAD
ncbi:MAG TPA: hypothetical protein VGB87_04620, partial [Vicinamibacteria bacterium]